VALQGGSSSAALRAAGLNERLSDTSKDLSAIPEFSRSVSRLDAQLRFLQALVTETTLRATRRVTEDYSVVLCQEHLARSFVQSSSLEALQLLTFNLLLLEF
jgi:hypothetical protein